MMKKAYSYILTGIFLFIFVIPTLLSFFIKPSDESTLSENRTMVKCPVFNWKQLDKFPSAFNDFYDDHFSLRPMGVKFYNQFNYFFLKKSPDETKAILGKDNWIFLGKDLDYYRGLIRLKKGQEVSLKNEFQKREDFLKEHHCKFLIVIIPTKKEIYPEYVPVEYYKYSKTTMTDQFIQIINQIQGIDLIDLRPVLKKAKPYYPELYHRYDHHWNDYGAFQAYQSIIDYVNQTWPTGKARRIDEFDEEIVNTRAGSLAKMLGVEDKISFYRYNLKPKFTYQLEKLPRKYDAPEGFAYPYAYENRFKNTNDSLPRIMMINDSFGEYLYKNLAEHASYSLFLFDAWEYKLHPEIILEEKPDLFVISIYESFIPNILQNLSN